MRITSEQELESLRYIFAMLGQMREMADQARSGMLAYLIEMAFIEAGDEIRQRESQIADAGQKRDSAA